MTRTLTVNDVKTLIHKVGLHSFYEKLLAQLTEDFLNWDQFNKCPRHVSHFPHGVIELMPTFSNDYYTVKYVNGHPYNPKQGKLTVAAVGLLADIETGYPQLFCEMTLLTAFRTSAVAALAAKHLACHNAQPIALIGTGAQSEFQALAHFVALGCTHFKYFDCDPKAMQKFSHNLKSMGFKLQAGNSIEETIKDSQIIITATADKKQATILANEYIQPGVHMNALGGDCCGKTELDPAILERCKIVVEYAKQTQIEGEIQNLSNQTYYAELWEIIAGNKPGRTSAEEITLFDSVGFAMEDYSILKLVHQLANQYNIGKIMEMVPTVEDPKNIFSRLELSEVAQTE